MAIAEGMKSITENIISSYDARVKTLGNIVADTRNLLGDARRILKGFAQERKKMSGEQAKNLAQFVDDLSKDIGNKLKQMTADRVKMSEELRKRLAEEINEIKNDVKKIRNLAKKRVKEFAQAHAQMSVALKKDLADYVGDIAKDVRKLLKGFNEIQAEVREDLAKARRTWLNMGSQLAKTKKRAGVSIGEKVTTVEKEIKRRKKVVR